MRSMEIAEMRAKNWEEKIRRQNKIKQETDWKAAENNGNKYTGVTKADIVKRTTFENPTEEEIQQLVEKPNDLGEKKNN